MTAYRLFFLDGSEHFVGAEVVDCPNDRDAIAAAAAFREKKCQAIEVWEHARLVGRVDADIMADGGRP